MNAWIDLEIVMDRVLTVEEQKALRLLHPGIINIHPRLKSEAVEVTSPQSREGKKIDKLFKDFYKFKMQAEISHELMGAFIEILNEEDEEVIADETEAS